MVFGVDRVVKQVLQAGQVLFDSSNPYSEAPNELDESTLNGPGESAPRDPQPRDQQGAYVS